MEKQHQSDDRRGLSKYTLVIVLLSLLTIAATFVIANGDAAPTTRAASFAATLAVYLSACVGVYAYQSKVRPIISTIVPQHDPEDTLRSIDEVDQYLSSSLSTEDVFRLVCSRLRTLVPFRSGVLYLMDDARSRLRVAEIDGPASAAAKGQTFDTGHGIIGKSFTTGTIGIDNTRAGDGGRSSVVIPLRRETEVFGVLQLCLDGAGARADSSSALYEAIGSRISPVILKSVARDKSRENALTDATTDLPNERAFHLILENQIAEAQRKREERPLTILTIDIKDFDGINQRFGHAAGDRVLNEAARSIKDSLRQMDFIARSVNDEFLAILPTATTEISREVIARVTTAFFGRKLKVTESDIIEIELNFGLAAFGEDGETAEQLLATARLRKAQAKSAEPNKVLWFPREVVN